MCFRRSTEVSALTAHFIINVFAILSSLICSSCPDQLSTFFYILTVTSWLVPAILCTSSLRIRSAKLTPHILRRLLRISTAFFYSSHIFFSDVSLPYNTVGTNTALCTAKRATVLMLRRLINTAKAPLTLLLYYLYLYLPPLLNFLPMYTT